MKAFLIKYNDFGSCIVVAKNFEDAVRIFNDNMEGLNTIKSVEIINDSVIVQ